MPGQKKHKGYPFSLEEFWSIYKKVPRLTVEIVIKSDKGILLALRGIEPFKGLWHIPGGTVYFGEKLSDAVKRVAQKELGINVTKSDFIGYVEYPSHYKNGYDSPVGLAFAVGYKGEVRPGKESSQIEWFENLPPNMHGDQSEFIKEKVLKMVI